MCGRFPNALDANRHAAAINDWLSRAHRGVRPSHGTRHERREEQGGGGHGCGPSDDGHGGADGAEGAESAEPDQEPPFVTASPGLDRGYHPTTNVAPTAFSPVLYRLGAARQGKQSDDTLLLEPMRWGLLPPSTKVIPKGQDMIRTINARADTILSGRGLWNSPFTKGKRCVVWTQGFYEWLATPQARLPHLIGMPNHGLGRTAADGKEREMMPMAGLWEECTLDDGTKVKSFAICTTEINKQLEWLHTRMPVILPDLRAMQVWLGTVEAPLSHVAALMRPYPGDLECYRVPQEVGKTGTDDAKFLLPIEQRKDGIARAFGRLMKRDAEEDGGASEQQHRAQLKKVKKEEDREIKTEAEKSGSSAPRHEDAIKREREVCAGGTLAMKEEEEKDSILRATEQVERDAQDAEITWQEEHKVDAGNIKRDPSESDQDQIKADRKFAEELQRSEGPSTANDEAKSEPPHVLDQHRGLSDSEPSAGKPARSSKFSPEPWNPPSSTFGSFDTRPSGNGKTSQASPTGPTRLENMLSAQRSAAHSRPGVPISPKSNGASRDSPMKGQAGSPKSKAKDGAAKGAPDIRSFFKQ